MACKKIEQQGISFIKIVDPYIGRRLDNYLINHFKNIPKSHVYKMIRKGEIRVNKCRKKQSYRLQAGDIIRLPPVYTTVAQKTDLIGRATGRLSNLISQNIIYEDEHIIVVNKPANIAVHRGSKIDYGIIDILRAQHHQAYSLELVHRLDRATSGCLVIAKSYPVLRQMHDRFRNGRVKKIYIALLKGHLAHTPQTVDAPLCRKEKLSAGVRVRVDKSGKDALTRFSLLKHFNSASLARIETMTGRTHQIRVHASSIGHPLALDQKYGDWRFNRAMKKSGLRRLFLHAQKLSFTMPYSGEQIELTAPLPYELNEYLGKLSQQIL